MRRGWQHPDCVGFFSSRRRHTRLSCDWSSDVCSSDLYPGGEVQSPAILARPARATLRARLAGIGRGACRERGENSGGAGSLKKKKATDDREAERFAGVVLYHREWPGRLVD